MSQGTSIIIGLVGGTALGAGLGVLLPETRSEPLAIGIITVCGALAGLGLGFAWGLIRRTDDERQQGTGLEGLAAASRGNGGVGLGIVICVLAVGWFFGGLAANKLYFYPPVLLVFGLISIGRGLMGKRAT